MINDEWSGDRVGLLSKFLLTVFIADSNQFGTKMCADNDHNESVCVSALFYFI